jgi:hypothetical protein
MVNNMGERRYEPLNDTEFRTVYGVHEHRLAIASGENNAEMVAYHEGVLAGLRLGLNPMEQGAASGWVPIK